MEARAFLTPGRDLAPGLGPSRAARRKVSLIARCQPSPRCRKYAITSRSRRSEICSLVGAFCGPRLRRYASTISGTTSNAGRARAHISSVISDASGSRAIPASSVIARAARNALRWASRHSRRDGPRIFSRFIRVCFAQADNSHVFLAAGKDKQIDNVADEAPRLLSQLPVVLAIVDRDNGQVPLEVLRQRKVDVVFAKVCDTLRFIPFVGWPLLHIPDGIVARTFRQTNCSDKKVGARL
jgi:hypothetical protein